MREDVLLVAGDPDAYPVEYYDPETGTFQGVIPRLLEEFGARAGCEIRYYDAGPEDRRASLEKNLQVDLVSVCLTGEGDHGEGLVALETDQNGQRASYALRLTRAAPDWLAGELSGFLSETSPAVKAGMLVESAQARPAIYHAKLETAALGLLAAVLVLGIALAVLAGKLRRRRRELRRGRKLDALTGLENLEGLGEGFQRFINDRNRVLYALFYFYLDLSDMQRGEADELLRRVAAALKDHAGDADLLARAAESGFAVLRLSPGDSETELWAASALRRIRETGCTRASAGVYRLRAGDGDLNEILARAAHSARLAGQAEEPLGFCTDGVLRAFLEERELRGQLERGFEHEEFKLYLQFYVDTKTGRPAGGKALSRWEHPDKGLLLPGQFLPCMEKEGAVHRLDLYAVEQSCAFLEELDRAGLEPFFLCCSLSKETVLTENFAGQCREVLERYRFPREMLVLELPEDMAEQNPGSTDAQITALRDLGVRLAAGGFGRDVSAFLAGQRPDILILSRVLIDAMGSGAGDTVLRTMIRLGHKLGCEVLAVGAEHVEQFHMLREMDCDMVQGYCLYTPIPAWEAEKQLIWQSKGDKNIQEVAVY